MSRGDRTTYVAHWARLTATLTRLRLAEIHAARHILGEVAVIDTITTGASWPWNLSTVPTRIAEQPAAASRRLISAPCALYGATAGSPRARSAAAVARAPHPRLAEQGLRQRRHRVGLLRRRHRAPLVADLDDVQPRLDALQPRAW